MIHKILRKISSLHTDSILAVLFVVFCISVGFGNFSIFLSNCTHALDTDATLQEFIETVDAQYYEMLTTDSENPLFQNKATYINLNGLMARTLGQRELNDTIRLNNGYLSWVGDSFTEEEMVALFENIQKFARKQKEQGKDFLFVLAPSKTYQYETNFPVGYEDSSNQDVELFLELMKENDISYVDLRKEMENDGLPFDEAFFVTDHHWKPQTGFWAYTKILYALQESGTIETVDRFYTDPENYQFDIYEDSFLGYFGKRTGIYYAGVDDFCIITPKFETNISVELPTKGILVTGEFGTAAYNYNNMGVLHEKDYFNNDPYDLYGWSNSGHTMWRNEHAPENKKIMMIGNSYGNIPFSLMSLYFASCEELDMRNFTEDFGELYDAYAPDAVVLLVPVKNITSIMTMYPFVQD